VDAVAERGRAAGCLHWEPQDVGGQVGYVCALTDPDGNVIEFSHGQAVYQTVQEKWRPASVAASEGGDPASPTG
jgi:lactoylglutathione lyase